MTNKPSYSGGANEEVDKRMNDEATLEKRKTKKAKIKELKTLDELLKEKH